jgi:hypothetical protein
MSGAIPPLSEYAFMAWCLVKHRDRYSFFKTSTEGGTQVIEKCNTILTETASGTPPVALRSNFQVTSSTALKVSA